MDTNTELLSIARRGLLLLGYPEALLRNDYPFADVLASPGELHRISLAAFGQDPPSYKTACLGILANDHDWPHDLRPYRSLGAPQLLTLHPTQVRRWKIKPEGDPELLGGFPPDRLLPTMIANRDEWGPEPVLRAKAIAFGVAPPQLDFFDAGLVPAIDGVARQKLHLLLGDTIAVAQSVYREHSAGEPDYARLFRLVFRLLAGKLLTDRGYPGGWTSSSAADVIRAVETFYFRDAPAPPALDQPQVQDVAWRHLRGGFHLQNISVGTLAHVYENTLVDEEIRRELSIHSTPTEIAEYMVKRLPFESLPRDERRVFEPFAGHAAFLIASLERLRDLLGQDMSSVDRHHYFVRMLSGIEKEPFAVEVARLSLMLADYPHPDGWQLHEDDVYSSPRLAEELTQARIVLCNPPYENFTKQEHAHYADLQTASKAVEILTRVLAKPPALLGFVLPRVLVYGRSYRSARQMLLDLYGHLEVVGLPDNVFAHSGAEPVLLLASGLHEESSLRRTVLVRKPDYQAFLTNGRPTLQVERTMPRALLGDPGQLWIDPLEHVWESVKHLPKLGDLAEIHRGIEYEIDFEEHEVDIISTTPRDGFVPGLRRMTPDFEPYTARSHVYLNLASNLMRTNAHQFPWGEPKVIVNAARKSRGAWRVVGALDRSGLVCYQRFHGVWSRTPIPVEVIAAVLNGLVANAFVGAREPGRDNQKVLLASIPVPVFTDSEAQSITRRVADYRRLRDELDVDASPSKVEHCRRLLDVLDEAVLSAYQLPAKLEQAIRRYFSGYTRPGPHLPTKQSRHGALNKYADLPLFAGLGEQANTMAVEGSYKSVPATDTIIVDATYEYDGLGSPLAYYYDLDED